METIMRLRTKLYIVIAGICIDLTAHGVPNVQVIRADVSNAGSEIQNFVDKAKLTSSLTEDVVQTDREAADILRYCLTDPNIEDLAIAAEKYPNNEFFLAQLAY
jgi:hypothetical protein